MHSVFYCYIFLTIVFSIAWSFFVANKYLTLFFLWLSFFISSFVILSFIFLSIDEGGRIDVTYVLNFYLIIWLILFFFFIVEFIVSLRTSIFSKKQERLPINCGEPEEWLEYYLKSTTAMVFNPSTTTSVGRNNYNEKFIYKNKRGLLYHIFSFMFYLFYVFGVIFFICFTLIFTAAGAEAGDYSAYVIAIFVTKHYLAIFYLFLIRKLCVSVFCANTGVNFTPNFFFYNYIVEIKYQNVTYWPWTVLIWMYARFRKRFRRVPQSALARQTKNYGLTGTILTSEYQYINNKFLFNGLYRIADKTHKKQLMSIKYFNEKDEIYSQMELFCYTRPAKGSRKYDSRRCDLSVPYLCGILMVDKTWLSVETKKYDLYYNNYFTRKRISLLDHIIILCNSNGWDYIIFRLITFSSFDIEPIDLHAKKYDTNYIEETLGTGPKMSKIDWLEGPTTRTWNSVELLKLSIFSYFSKLNGRWKYEHLLNKRKKKK